MFSHLVDELFKNGFNVVLGWIQYGVFPLTLKPTVVHMGFKEARFVTRRSMLMAEVIHILSKQIPDK
jgi:uncharacterized membrane protein